MAEYSYSQNLIPSSTDEVAQRRPTRGELNSTRTRAEPVNNVIIFNAIPRQRELRPLKCADENCLPGVTLEQKTYHPPFKAKRAWYCEEHRTKARNTRKRVMRQALPAQSVFEHDPFQHRTNQQWCCFNHLQLRQLRNERRLRQRRRGNKKAWQVQVARNIAQIEIA